MKQRGYFQNGILYVKPVSVFVPIFYSLTLSYGHIECCPEPACPRCLTLVKNFEHLLQVNGPSQMTQTSKVLPSITCTLVMDIVSVLECKQMINILYPRIDNGD